MKMYLVGGAVRDKLLGIPSKDMDYAVEAADFDTMLREIETMVKKPEDIFQIRPEFNTIRANVIGIGAADFVLCRKDGTYSDGRRPDSVEAGTILEDLARRDFTMNAIAYDIETGDVIDPHKGIGDIEDKVIRTVGDPYERFGEDSLRMIRAIRFAITKDFILSEEIRSALRDPALIGMLRNVSTERIREEMEKAFREDTLATLEILDLYKGIRRAIFAKRLRLLATMKG